MTLQTKLQFGDNATGHYTREYRVVSYHNGVGRMFHAFNPLTVARDTDIQITIVAPSKEDLSLYEWFVDNSMMSGRIVFDIMDVKSPGGILARSLYFYDAYCVTLKDRYDIHQKTRRMLTLVLTPAKIKVEEVEFEREGYKADDRQGGKNDDDVDMDKYNRQYDF